jgi:hypothetical protein
MEVMELSAVSIESIAASRGDAAPTELLIDKAVARHDASG